MEPVATIIDTHLFVELSRLKLSVEHPDVPDKFTFGQYLYLINNYNLYETSNWNNLS